MTAPRVSLRRPVGKPAGNLYRVTAAVTFVTLPLFWVLDELLATTAPDPCANLPRGAVCEPVPALDRSDGSPSGLQLFLWTMAAELIVIACYLVVALARRTVEPRAALRCAPAAAALVLLAVGGFGWLFDHSGNTIGLNAVGVGYLVVYACWLFAPVVLSEVHRGDQAAVVPVVIGLTPTAVVNALFQEAITALPAVMLVVAIVTVVVVHARARR